MPYPRILLTIVFGLFAFAACGGARAQQNIGSTALAENKVSRELSGASGPLSSGDPVFRNEAVSTGEESKAKLIFLDSTNLAIGPISRVTLDRFVYVGETNGQEMSVNLARGVFRFTTGALDKNAYRISTPTATTGVRGTVLDIDVRSGQSKTTLVEGQALVCPRRAGESFAQQERNCTRAAGGVGGPRCDCVDLRNAGQTAQVKKNGQATLTSNAVNFAAFCGGDSSLCSGNSYADQGGGFAAGALCGR